MCSTKNFVINKCSFVTSVAFTESCFRAESFRTTEAVDLILCRHSPSGGKYVSLSMLYDKSLSVMRLCACVSCWGRYVFLCVFNVNT